MVGVEDIKSAIVDREEELNKKFEQERIIDREGFEKIKKLVSKDSALVITGVRRCGKSILAYMIGRLGKYAYVNFEDERLSLESAELNKVLEAVYSLKGDVDYLLFDEIQNIGGWEKFVSRLVTNKKVIITGSNARLLNKELATFLTGRHIDATLFPFSFREFLNLKEVEPNIYLTKDIAKIKNNLEEYLERGGFPLSYKLGKMFLLENYKDIIERDVMQRYPIRYAKVMKDLAKYLVSNVSNEISYNKLKNVFGVRSVHTIKNYISYLENSYIVFLLERFSFKLKEQVLAPKKVYCIDPGTVNAVGFRFMEKKGDFIENLVAVELKRRITLTDLELYYWKDHQQREVDFVLKQGKKVEQLIQVSLDVKNINTKKRETDSLLKASSDLNCKNLLVITWDFESTEKVKGNKIAYIPLWKWLLQ